MKQSPNIYTLRGLFLELANGTMTDLPNGRWVPARPLGFYSIGTRLRAAWLAFTGRGDVVIWPGEEEDAGLPETRS